MISFNTKFKVSSLFLLLFGVDFFQSIHLFFMRTHMMNFFFGLFLFLPHFSSICRLVVMKTRLKNTFNFAFNLVIKLRNSQKLGGLIFKFIIFGPLDNRCGWDENKSFFENKIVERRYPPWKEGEEVLLSSLLEKKVQFQTDLNLILLLPLKRNNSLAVHREPDSKRYQKKKEKKKKENWTDFRKEKKFLTLISLGEFSSSEKHPNSRDCASGQESE